MSGARNKLRASADHITSLRCLSALLVVIIAAQWWRIGYLQDVRRLYLPPDLSQGVLIELDHMPAPVVYTFAYYIFHQLHRWEHDGEKDYAQQIYQLQAFLTPDCIHALQADHAQKNQRGELRHRTRMMQEIIGRAYHAERVQAETDSAWRVWIDVNLREAIDGHPVKNVNVQYPLRVVRFDVDREKNPWGLALACNARTQAIRLNAQALDTPFETPPDRSASDE